MNTAPKTTETWNRRMGLSPDLRPTLPAFQGTCALSV